jgi:hypothetical protein
MMLDIPLLGIQRMKQDGWGRRRHKWSRVFCRLLGRDAQKSFRKNSDSPQFSLFQIDAFTKCIAVVASVQRYCQSFSFPWLLL